MIFGVRRENPTGVLSEEVKLHPIKSFGEEDEEESRVRFSMFIACLQFWWRRRKRKKMKVERLFGLKLTVSFRHEV